MEVAFCGNLAEIDREVRLCHLAFESFLKRPAARAGEKGDVILRPVERREKRYSLNVIPVEMCEKYLRMNRRPAGFLHQCLAQRAYAAPGIEYHALVRRR